MDWDLNPGDRILRTKLHVRFGGSQQGGMSPSRSTPNVLLFTDPSVGEHFGYIDHWHEDGCFHYTGMGQTGDQVMKQGNAAVLNHRAEGRALRLFQGCKGEVLYVGQFNLEIEKPWHFKEAIERG